jgi:hypothetical protein
MCDNENEDYTVEILPIGGPVLVKKLKKPDRDERLLDGMEAYSGQEYAWLKWFYSLSYEDRKIVQVCGERGVTVIEANFHEMKKITMELDAWD